jgi:hypothetical protein
MQRGSGVAQTQMSRSTSQSKRSARFPAKQREFARFLVKQREYIASRPGGRLSTAILTSCGESHSSKMICNTKCIQRNLFSLARMMCVLKTS